MISESTEITENNEGYPHPRIDAAHSPPKSHRGWIFYDAQCSACSSAAKRFEALFARRGFEFVPLQTPWARQRLGLDSQAPLEEMRVLTSDNRDLGGAAAVIFLASQVWWAQPVAFLAGLPGLRAIAEHIYRWIAAHRSCTASTCRLSSPNNSRDETSSSFRLRTAPWLGFVIPIFALLARPGVAPWVFMWLMAGAIFFACKWLTFSRAKQSFSNVGLARSAAYLFLWPGMDAATFLKPQSTRRIPGSALIPAILKILLGVALLFILARRIPNPLLVGWIGMIGMILILHFGLFEFISIFWRKKGIPVRSIMNAPIKAASLTEFWGRRWNGAFNQLVLDLFFRPLSHALGATGATLIAFFISGLVHETVISLPAGGGFGLPTGYFVMQAAAC